MRAIDLAHAERLLVTAFEADDEGEITRLSRLVDELDAASRKPLPSMLAAALWYVGHGVPVFPLTERAKTPLPRSHGCRDATVDVDAVRAWWGRFPNANIGIATGHVVDVIDIDGLRGNIALAGMLGDAPHALDHVIGKVSTPRPGGRHLYVPTRAGYSNGAKLDDGIDYRGRGGYVVAPPSYVVERTYEGRYTWTQPLTLPA